MGVLGLTDPSGPSKETVSAATSHLSPVHPEPSHAYY